jgi:hypothetical protein
MSAAKKTEEDFERSGLAQRQAEHAGKLKELHETVAAMSKQVENLERHLMISDKFAELFDRHVTASNRMSKTFDNVVSEADGRALSTNLKRFSKALQTAGILFAGGILTELGLWLLKLLKQG